MAKKAAAPAMAPSLASEPLQWSDVDVLTAAKDTRPITPAEIQAHPELSSVAADDAYADYLADLIAEKLVEVLGDGREPWRQEYLARVVGWGDHKLTLPRGPVEEPIADSDGESVPAVVLIDGSADSVTISETIEAETYRIQGRCRDRLFRDRFWIWTTAYSDEIRPEPVPGLERPDYEVGGRSGALGLGAAGSYTAGYLMPGQVGSNPEGPKLSPATAPVTGWVASTAYGADQSTAYGDDRGSFIVPADRSVSYVLECTTAGTSGAGPTEPTWNTTIGGTTDDNGLIWTTRAAHVFSPTIRQALWLMAPLVDKESRGAACDASAWLKIRSMLERACI